jgi:predicted small metal-binding protein
MHAKQKKEERTEILQELLNPIKDNVRKKIEKKHPYF